MTLRIFRSTASIRPQRLNLRTNTKLNSSSKWYPTVIHTTPRNFRKRASRRNVVLLFRNRPPPPHSSGEITDPLYSSWASRPEGSEHGFSLSRSSLVNNGRARNVHTRRRPLHFCCRPRRKVAVYIWLQGRDILEAERDRGLSC